MAGGAPEGSLGPTVCQALSRPRPVMTRRVHGQGPFVEAAAVSHSPNRPFLQVLPFSVIRAGGASPVKPPPNTQILPASQSLGIFKSFSWGFVCLDPALSVSSLSAGQCHVSPHRSIN